ITLLALTPCWWAVWLSIFLQDIQKQLSTQPLLFAIFTALILIGMIVVLVAFIKGAREAYAKGKARHFQRQAPGSPRTLYIGPLGICHSDLFIQLFEPN